ncbi:ABC transporter substrate-binding protein [Blastococcus saxobsidens]|uniref:Iron (III) dicitrate transport system (Iron (III)-binding protein) n=1 Tax=Blastococcus saxobsidens (strain DD2) TaxID=1146883 RepID=H6RU95_BLASD|nr:iron-siderophore ABC transporter substrate-binding protein [Blastococcus saxobsidens]CCG05702.1 Iron (III) dicitrate transport system (iron (III)-binding protein) [Blastococcus saxobsidens DD2]
MRLRSLTTAVLTVAALSACGSSAEDVAEEPQLADEPAVEEEVDAAEPRLVEHAMGATEVPADPERVVVLDTPHLDTALSLGVTPVGSVQSSVAEGLPGYLGDRTEGIEIVGTIEEPDLEAIAALDPDLILSSQVRHEQIYDQLSQIAPTVFTDYEEGWQAIFDTSAEALGLAEEGEQALAEYEQQADEVGEAIGAEGATASLVRFLPDETRIYGPETFAGSVLTDVGFELPELGYDEYSMAYISPEQIEQAAADVIFSTTYGDPAATTQGAVTALWENLEAVPDCQFDVEDDEWMLGIGLIGAEIVLDDVESFLAEGSCL